MGGSRVVRLHASLVLFFSICKLLLDKKKKNKEKKRKLLPFAKVFSLANEVFFDLREIRPKNYYSWKFLSKILRFFDLAKVFARESFCP